MKTYRINEVFCSLQGEGIRAGTPNVFVRFSGCNQTCSLETHGFDCDTEFTSGRDVSMEELECLMRDEAPSQEFNWAIFTGGEPGLQVDRELIDFLHERGWKLAIETNGSIALPDGLDWVTVSPKVAEHAIRQETADEVKYVRGHGQAIPRPRCKAAHQLISPAFNSNALDERSLQWCIQLVKQNPDWRLSLQQHKVWMVR